MTAIHSLFLSLILILSVSATSLADPAAPLVGLPSVTPPSAAPAQTPEAPLSADDKKKLSRQMKKSLSDETSAFDRQERSATKELVLSQSQHAKSWKEQEKRTRHQFFNDHTKGSERRQYVQDYQIRLKEFDKSLRDEAAKSKSDWKQKREALKQSQKDREAQFKTALDQNKRPDPSVFQPK